MSPCLKTDDEITLCRVGVSDDGYGTEAIVDSAVIPAAIDMNTGATHGNNQDAIISDAVVYIRPREPFVIANFNRLEEMLVVIPLFDTPEAMAWYRVIKVNVARDTQLCNKVDHLELQLQKTEPVAEIS